MPPCMRACLRAGGTTDTENMPATPPLGHIQKEWWTWPHTHTRTHTHTLTHTHSLHAPPSPLSRARSTTLVATILATTASRKTDGPCPELRKNWGGKEKEPVTPKAVMAVVIIHGMADTLAILLTDPTTSPIMYRLLDACPPGGVMRVAGLSPLPAYKNPYNYKQDTYRFTRSTTFQRLPNATRRGAASLKYLSDKGTVSTKHCAQHPARRNSHWCISHRWATSSQLPNTQHTTKPMRATQFMSAYKSLVEASNPDKPRPSESQRWVIVGTLASEPTITKDRAKTTIHAWGDSATPLEVTVWRADTAAAPQVEDLSAAPIGTVLYVCLTLSSECRTASGRGVTGCDAGAPRACALCPSRAHKQTQTGAQCREQG